VADLIRNVLAAIGALTVAVWALGAVLSARTVLRERRAARRTLPPPGDPEWDRLWADLLDPKEKP